MKRFADVLVAVVFLMVSFTVFAQSKPPLGIGKVVTAKESQAWIQSVGPSGKSLLPGKGTAKQGAALYTQRCIFCHGPEGQNGPYNSLKGHAMMTYSTSLWDYIHRAMPRSLANPGIQEMQLSPDDVYSLTAYLLFLNGVVKENDVLDNTNLAKTIIPVSGKAPE